MGSVCGLMERRGAEMIKLLFLLLSFAQASQVKELKLKPQEVGVVNTAVGYSTVVQLSQKPLNVVIGDQTSFRVEFINDSITIKPLRPGAKTNLFIFTENDRFNLTIRVGPAAAVDYVVRVRRIFSDPQKTVQLNLTRSKNGLTFTLLRITHKDSEAFLDFTVQNQRKKFITLNPEHFRVTVDNVVRTIRSLYIDTPSIKPGAWASGSLLVPSHGLGHLTVWLGLLGDKPVSFTFNRSVSSNKEVLRAF